MKILSKEQIYEGDALTVKRQNISSTELMERAGTQIFNWMHLRMQGAQVPIHVFCGIGNNGGDGLVLARHLHTHGYNVFTYIVNYSDKRSDDFLENYERIKSSSKNWPDVLSENSEFPKIGPDDIIVDAIFGIGLNRPPAKWIKDLFAHFKSSKAFTLSIDIPSGLYTDAPVASEEDVIQAQYTLSFQSPKLVFFLPETAQFTQQWEVLDIGIDRDYLKSVKTDAMLIGKHEVLPFYKPRLKYSHKGTYGHALIIGGSYGKIGAVQLCSHSALSTGAGAVTAFVPKCGYNSLQTALPELMLITDDHHEEITAIKYNIKPNVIGIGPGLGQSDKTFKAFEEFLKSNQTPLVIDADALNFLSKSTSLLDLIPERSVLTPHPGELKRLIGSWTDDFDKLEKTKQLSKKHNLIIIIKGAHTITVDQDLMYINTTGNPGMATAGSGDVLTGIITGLIAQDYKPLEASLFGIYLHGKAGDLVLEELGYQSLLARHIIKGLPKAYLNLFEQPDQEQQANDTKEES